MSIIDFLHITSKAKTKRLTDSETYYKSKFSFYTQYLKKYCPNYYIEIYNQCDTRHKTAETIKLRSGLNFGQEYHEVLNFLGQPSFSYRYQDNEDHIILAYKNLEHSAFITMTYHFYKGRLLLVGHDYANITPDEQRDCLFAFIDQFKMSHLKKLENPFLMEDPKGNFMLAHVNRRLKVYLGSPEILSPSR